MEGLEIDEDVFDEGVALGVPSGGLSSSAEGGCRGVLSSQSLQPAPVSQLQSMQRASGLTHSVWPDQKSTGIGSGEILFGSQQPSQSKMCTVKGSSFGAGSSTQSQHAVGSNRSWQGAPPSSQALPSVPLLREGSASMVAGSSNFNRSRSRSPVQKLGNSKTPVGPWGSDDGFDSEDLMGMALPSQRVVSPSPAKVQQLSSPPGAQMMPALASTDIGGLAGGSRSPGVFAEAQAERSASQGHPNELVPLPPMSQQRSWGKNSGSGTPLPRRAEEVNVAEDDESALEAMSRSAGPPGPAGEVLALPQAPDINHSSSSLGRSAPVKLSRCISWLKALRNLNLPFDAFHLGISKGCQPINAGQQQSALEANNLRYVLSAAPWPPKRWHLLVLIRRVELLAGEIHVIVCDPTSETSATIDRRVAQAWPRAVCEGSALLLADVVAVPPVRTSAAASSSRLSFSTRLLITERSVKMAIAPGEVQSSESAELLAAASQASS
eukprot:TRINITY_DN7167_c1_g1_i3.p1 TRINITY_DN7167_c1_g1~~TRINITY_DN7167_c1_g1_i3.p1  ORF type:complete len:494 (-),score=94.62 TRINITY_DN7167_c1_g1_i3:354-1835(-)